MDVMGFTINSLDVVVGEVIGEVLLDLWMVNEEFLVQANLQGRNDRPNNSDVSQSYSVTKQVLVLRVVFEVNCEDFKGIFYFLFRLVKFLLAVGSITLRKTEEGIQAFQTTASEVHPLIDLGLCIRSCSKQASVVGTRTSNVISDRSAFEDCSLGGIQGGHLPVRIFL